MGAGGSSASKVMRGNYRRTDKMRRRRPGRRRGEDRREVFPITVIGGPVRGGCFAFKPEDSGGRPLTGGETTREVEVT